MIALLAQCPCSGQGGGIAPFLAMIIVAVAFMLVGSTRSRKDLSGMNKAAKVAIIIVLLVIVGVVYGPLLPGTQLTSSHRCDTLGSRPNDPPYSRGTGQLAATHWSQGDYGKTVPLP